MAGKIEFTIRESDNGFKLISNSEIELESQHFGKIASIISERLHWNHLGTQLAGMDGIGLDFEKKPDGTTLSINDTTWFGFEVESNSKEILEKIKIILEEIFSKNIFSSLIVNRNY